MPWGFLADEIDFRKACLLITNREQIDDRAWKAGYIRPIRERIGGETQSADYVIYVMNNLASDAHLLHVEN